jgi:hypothetical protein
MEKGCRIMGFTFSRVKNLKDDEQEMVRVRRRTYIKTKRTLANWTTASYMPRLDKSEGMSMKEDE